ncbi:MAG TPA: carbohydrate binding domain-containing protein [Candidatus Saccharimonadia bacterium]
MTLPWNSPSFAQAGTTFWFAPGVHTLGAGQYSQIMPGDNTTFLGAPGAIIDGGRDNQYAFTGTHTGVTIKYLTVQNFGVAMSNRDEGVVNHDRGAGWTISNNTFVHNEGAAVMLGSNNLLSYNCLKDNGQYGFSTVPPQGANNLSNVTLDHNEIAGNNTDDWENHVPGCGCTGGGKFWETTDATITNNYVHDNKSVGIWADTNNVGFQLEGNYIANNDGQGFLYEISYNALVKDNNFLRNGLVNGPANIGFPTGAIYLSESGGDSRVANSHNYSTIEVTGNSFTDNWSGVVEWENADRYCGSPNNTSGGTCTLVNPGVANLSTCVAGTIANAPYYNDCRWKTQNVLVHGNIFAIDKSAIASCAAAPNSCGLQGLFSNFGSSPAWSPYRDAVVANAIAGSQNNTFTDNEYTGDWHIMAHDQSTVLSPSVWQASPYSQDAGSTFVGGSSSTPAPTPTPSPTVTSTPAPTASASKTFESDTNGMHNWFGASVTQSSAQAHSGTHSLAITEDSQFWGVEEQLPPAAQATAGTVYTVSGWVRAGASPESLNLSLRWMDSSNNGISLESVATGTATTDGWTHLAGVLTAPAGAVSAQFIVASSGGTAGSVIYLDDLAISPVPAFSKTFESGLDGMQTWFNASVAQSSARVHDGTHSLAITESDAFWGIEEHLTPQAQVVAGVPYRVGGWFMGSATAEPVKLLVRWLDDTNISLALDTVATAQVSADGWVQLAGNLTAPAGATAAQIVVQSPGGGAAGSTIYLDDITISPR